MKTKTIFRFPVKRRIEPCLLWSQYSREKCLKHSWNEQHRHKKKCYFEHFCFHDCSKMPNCWWRRHISFDRASLALQFCKHRISSVSNAREIFDEYYEVLLFTCFINKKIHRTSAIVACYRLVKRVWSNESGRENISTSSGWNRFEKYCSLVEILTFFWGHYRLALYQKDIYITRKESYFIIKLLP